MRSSGVCHQGVSPPSEGTGRDRGLRRQGDGACREDLSLTAARKTDVTQTPADAKVVSMVTLVIDQEAVAVVERMLAELGQVKVVPADVAAARQVYIYI